MKKILFSLGVILVVALPSTTIAELKLPAIIGDNMVLQQGQEIPVWGWDSPGQSVSVQFGDVTVSAMASEDGRWSVRLPAMNASALLQKMTIMGSSEAVLQDILIGEVWLCSGQSNMQWSMDQLNDSDLERLTANYPKMRHISIPHTGTQEPQTDFKGRWKAVAPENIGQFSAVCYFFGRILHNALKVPIGLIDNAWGGSVAEAWVRRDLLEANPIYSPYLEEFKARIESYDKDKAKAQYESRLDNWKTSTAVARAARNAFPKRPGAPQDPSTGPQRPANLFNGVLYPIIGYGVRGVIWYQGEANRNRAWTYRFLFPLLISHWRSVWAQGDFPFYWVQLGNFKSRFSTHQDSIWAELREAQSMTLSLPNTGQAVITDLGDANDLHPKDKEKVAKRLARLALAKDYGFDIVAENPRYSSHIVHGNKVIVTFENIGGGMDTLSKKEAIGFVVAGENQVFHLADAKVIGKDRIEVASEAVSSPVAVRYAWEDNPVVNVQSAEGLPLTPFRTDDWKMLTKPE